VEVEFAGDGFLFRRRHNRQFQIRLSFHSQVLKLRIVLLEEIPRQRGKKAGKRYTPGPKGKDVLLGRKPGGKTIVTALEDIAGSVSGKVKGIWGKISPGGDLHLFPTEVIVV